MQTRRGEQVIRYRYANLQPPGPLVNLTVRDPISGNQLDLQPAIIDPAADRTVLPGKTISALGLIEDGHLHFQGFTSEVVELPVFLVELRLHDFAPVRLRAALGEHEPFILLGRDMLNHYRIVLDGPQQFLEIEPP
jgi:hypothetical protein